jgi:Rieske Fe-S protein
MTEPEIAPAASRRALIAGVGAAAAVVVAGCSTYNANNGGVDAGAPTTTSPAAPGTGAAGGGTSAGGGGSAAAPAALATTADIPVDGGKILTDKKIVITQPAGGTFKAFTAVCTHQGCTVGSISGGAIHCPCHGSAFSIKDGSVVNGPATSPLAPVAIKVDGTSIVQG